VSQISQRDFDFFPAGTGAEAESKWSYRRAILALAGACCIAWAAVIITGALLLG
jgi:hypothetical protein